MFGLLPCLDQIVHGSFAFICLSYICYVMLCDGFFYFLMSIPLLFNCLSMLCLVFLVSSCLVYGM